MIIKKGKTMYLIGGFVLLIFVLPNTINFKERAYFSDEKRLEWAAEEYNIALGVPDSVNLIPGGYYARGPLHELFMGRKYRPVWSSPVRVPVFSYQQTLGGLKPVKMGGNQQTIGMDLADSLGREWALRSVDKDQSKALPGILRPTPLRFMIRDQAAALNPYGALVVPVLAEAIGVYHTNPRLVFVPYDSSMGEYNEVMAGRLAILEEDADESWAGSKTFNYPLAVLDTDSMQQVAEQEAIPLDTLLYARSRLLDLLISDWDRHTGQWSWVLSETENGRMFRPLPVDRDMAFFRFNEGLIPKLTLLVNSKFQSFRKEYGNLKGLAYQARQLDKAILPGLSKEEFVDQAIFIKERLNDEVIRNAFQQYPENIYEQFGAEHIETLIIRRDKLPKVAEEFYGYIE